MLALDIFILSFFLFTSLHEAKGTIDVDIFVVRYFNFFYFLFVLNL